MKKILIIDDELIIRRTAESCLKSIGCQTESTIDGQSGILLYQSALEKQEPFDMVIIDLTIHGNLDGLEVIKELLKIDPQVRGIVSTGYSDGDVITNYKNYGFCGILSKPYTMQDLLDIVHDSTQ